MADITWTDVTAHAPVLSTVAAGAQADILAYVNGAVDPSVLDGESGSRTKLARCYLAAHLATVEKRGAAAGPLVSQSVGGMSRSYGVAASSSALGETGFGRMYQAIVNVSRARWPMVL